MNNSILNNSKVLVIALGVTVLVVLIMGISLFRSNQQISALGDMMDMEKQELTKQYQELTFNFNDSLKTDNDSLNNLVIKQKAKIGQYIEEIKLLKLNNASKIREYKKELEDMRIVLRHYVIQVDSLYQLNTKLKNENKTYVEKLSTTQNSVKILEVEKAKLVRKVDLAAKLDLKNIITAGLNPRDNETKKASRVAKIHLSFTIAKNVSAPIGEKILYLRVTDPNGKLLTESESNKFRFEGKEIGFSSQKSIEYGGEEMQANLFFNTIEGGLEPGKYDIEIFADGNNIGTSSLMLK